MKKVIGAYIEQVLEFDTKEEADQYVTELQVKNQLHLVLSQSEYEGKYRMRLRKRYNKNDFII